MIEVRCYYRDLWYAKDAYERRPQATMLVMKVEDGSGRFEVDLSIAEAKELAYQLTEWLNEFQPTGEEDSSC